MTPEQQVELQRAARRTNLMPFFELVFGLVAGNRLKPNWHLKAIAYELEEVVAGRNKRLVITMPPRSAKSIFASVALPAWVLGHNPRAEIICVSYAQDLATKLHNQCRTVMRSPAYRKIFPNSALSASKNTETEFQLKRGGSRFATSVNGVLTGRGADILVIDDPMKPGDAMSDAVRVSTNAWYDMTVLSRLNDQVEGAIIVVMQRLHVDDLAGHILEQGGWRHLNLPAIAFADETIQIGHAKVHRRRVGDLLHPEHVPHDKLDELKRTMGSLHFSAQYLQSPVPIGGNLFEWEWLRPYAVPPRRERYDEVIQSWDTASKDGVLNDYSVCTTWLLRDDDYYLLDLHRERLDFPRLRRRVLDLADRHKPSGILIEDKASGMHLAQELRNTCSYCIIPVEPEGDKVTRASSSSLEMEGGRVFLPERADWRDELRVEMLAFPHGRHDDQVDSISQLILWARERNQNCPRIREL